jgi:dethiobiotin synthetase
MTHAYFITGTDTNVGKTVIAAALLHKARAAGLTTLGLKPVAAGGSVVNGEFGNEDARWLRELSAPQPAYADVNPAALRAAIAPHIAAEREGRSLDAKTLAEHCRTQAKASEFCVVEGAGGWDVPLNDQESMPDLAIAIGYPVILVAGIRLGCINHSLLTVASIQASGLPIAGWIANQIEADMPALDENIAALSARIDAPLLGRVALQKELSLAAIAACLSPDVLPISR